MKVKTSVSLSDDVLKRIDERIGTPGRRSDFIEKAVREHLARVEREEQETRDIEIYDCYADEFEAEALDVLEDQADIDDQRWEDGKREAG